MIGLGRVLNLRTDRQTRRGFTLTELLITISIIGIMASMVMFAMFSAQEAARKQKTRALITKLNNIVMRRYESYKTRRVPAIIPAQESYTDSNGNGVYDNGTDTLVDLNNNNSLDTFTVAQRTKARIDCLRDLMRMEMPDRWSDVSDPPATPIGWHSNYQIARPAASQAYLNRFVAAGGVVGAWPIDEKLLENQSAECLYLIVTEALAQEGDAREVFKANDIGDTDGDGLLEFLDAWGKPILFLRWAPGFQSDLQTPYRITGDVAVTGTTATLSVTGNLGSRLSQTSGSYVGGTLAYIDPSTGLIHPEQMGRISGYVYSITGVQPNLQYNVKFTCQAPTGAQPFGGTNPPADSEFVVMMPDPFDTRGVYPNATWPTPTYALYPLIYSAGPDKVYAIKEDYGSVSPAPDAPFRWRYTNPLSSSTTPPLPSGSVLNAPLTPFVIAQPITETYGLMFGSAPSKGTEIGWKAGAHNDNITNHNLSAR